jgi:Tfp pilus assembly PilM family ATPase
MDKIGLPETIEALRAELREAIRQGQDEAIQFPVAEVQLEFQVSVSREGSTDGKLKVWVVELSAAGAYTRESLHKITLTLDPPVDASGHPIKVHRQLRDKP